MLVVHNLAVKMPPIPTNVPAARALKKRERFESVVNLAPCLKRKM